MAQVSYIDRKGVFAQREAKESAAAFRPNAAELTWFGGCSYKGQISEQWTALLLLPATERELYHCPGILPARREHHS